MEVMNVLTGRQMSIRLQAAVLAVLMLPRKGNALEVGHRLQSASLSQFAR